MVRMASHASLGTAGKMVEIPERRRQAALNFLVFYPLILVVLLQAVGALLPGLFASIPLATWSRVLWDTQTPRVAEELGATFGSGAATSFLLGMLFGKLNLVLGLATPLLMKRLFGLADFRSANSSPSGRLFVKRLGIFTWLLLAVLILFGGAFFPVDGESPMFPTNAVGVIILVSLQAFPVLAVANSFGPKDLPTRIDEQSTM